MDGVTRRLRALGCVQVKWTAPFPSHSPATGKALMAFTYIENTATLDERLVSFDKVPQAADKDNAIRRIKKSWDGVMSDLNGLAGIRLSKPDFDAVAEALIKSGTHAVIFDLVLTKSEFRLDIVVGKVTFKAGSVKVPSELEEYRSFLALLNGWSNSDRNIVPDADFKKFNDNNPKIAAKTKFKTFDELVKGSKADLDAFRAWAKGNSNAKKALEAVDKTAKAKASDPARAAALKAINAALQEYNKTF
jgi:hypothetical protein